MVPHILPPEFRPTPVVHVQTGLPTAPLRDPRFRYDQRFRELEHRTLGGPDANPTFGPVVAQSDVHYRLMVATGRGLDSTERGLVLTDAATAWRDTALAGSLLAFNRLVDETLERAPQIRAARVAADMLVNPNLNVRTTERGPRVEHRVGSPRARRLDDEAQTFGIRRLPPSFGLGMDWSVRGADEDPRSPLVRYGAWLALNNLGISNLRGEYDALNQTWNITGRQRLYGQLYLMGTTRSELEAVNPATWSVGLLYSPSPAWSLRFERKERWDRTEAPDYSLSLRIERRTQTPRAAAFW